MHYEARYSISKKSLYWVGQRDKASMFECEIESLSIQER